jgi:hypothetical protein
VRDLQKLGRFEESIDAMRQRLALTPIMTDDHLVWCAEHDRDPERSDSRASYGRELVEECKKRCRRA